MRQRNEGTSSQKECCRVIKCQLYATAVSLCFHRRTEWEISLWLLPDTHTHTHTREHTHTFQFMACSVITWISSRGLYELKNRKRLHLLPTCGHDYKHVCVSAKEAPPPPLFFGKAFLCESVRISSPYKDLHKAKMSIWVLDSSLVKPSIWIHRMFELVLHCGSAWYNSTTTVWNERKSFKN